jgi:hypothetical protein
MCIYAQLHCYEIYNRHYSDHSMKIALLINEEGKPMISLQIFMSNIQTTQHSLTYHMVDNIDEYIIDTN